MANEFRHKRSYKIVAADDSLATFADTDDAIAKVAFKAAHDGNSVTKTYALEDTNTTLVATYECANETEHTNWKAAVDALWVDGVSNPFKKDNPGTPNADQAQLSKLYDVGQLSGTITHFKTEWLHKDGSVSSTWNIA